MAVTTTHQVVRSTYDEWRDRRWRLTSAAIGLMAAVAVALMVTLGMRPASYGDLLSDVAESKVVEVDYVGGEELSPGDQVELRWSVLAGVLDQYALVTIDDSRGYDAWDESVFVSAGDPRETLLSINPGLQVTDASDADAPSVTFMEWRAPWPVAVLALASWLAVLLLLVGGPEPWRATRWAWFWIWLSTGPFGALAYLLLGGPLGMGRPRNPARRLTGGWAFLISIVFFGGSSAGA